MNVVFADTFYFLAFLGERDSKHDRAMEFSQEYTGRTVTTAWVLTEVADALSAPEERPSFLKLLKLLSNSPTVTIVPPSESLFRRGLDLYAARPDKAWSLTDCISFVVMDEHAITEALTGDHHFEQAGFTALLR
jgi:predicted nucleic acid-binding protein